MLVLVAWTGCRDRSPAAESTAPETATVAPATAPVDAQGALRLVPPEEWPPLVDDGDPSSLRTALVHSIRWLERQPDERPIVFGPRTVTTGALAESLVQVRAWLDEELSPARLAAEVGRVFDLYESVGGASGRMLVTGYFEPVIDGSLVRRPGYEVPIYRPPTDLIRIDLGAFADDLEGRRIAGRFRGGRFEPFPDRRGIRTDSPLRGRELAWARDRVALFFLEIQGSGSLRLPDGRIVRIGYAGSNGRSYRSIGKLLIDEGTIPREQMSMQALRAHLAEQPAEEVDRILDHNLSMVFFRRLDGPPLGSLGVPVTGGRSVATDRKLMPRGALGFLLSDVPALAADGTTFAERPLTRFVLNQDTGGAIKGAGRVDFFWGRGEDAAYRAGAMKQPGRLFFFVPKAVTEDDAPVAAVPAR